MPGAERAKDDVAAIAGDRGVTLERAQVEDGRIGRMRGLGKGIAEPRDQGVGGVAISPDRQARAPVVDNLPQVVEAVDMVGMLVGIDDTV